VGAGHGEAALEPRDLRQQVAAVEDRQPEPARLRELRVLVPDRGRDDELRAIRQVRRVVPDRRLDPSAAEALDVRRLGPVGPADGRAERVRHEGQPAHPGAADPDEVKPAAGPVRGAHRGATLAAW
jgi:hypothetical protein